MTGKSIKGFSKSGRGGKREGAGRKAGGKNKVTHEVKDLARRYTARSIERLAFWLDSDNPKASVSAAQTLLDRGWGKAPQAITGEEGGPLVVEIVRFAG